MRGAGLHRLIACRNAGPSVPPRDRQPDALQPYVDCLTRSAVFAIRRDWWEARTHIDAHARAGDTRP